MLKEMIVPLEFGATQLLPGHAPGNLKILEKIDDLNDVIKWSLQ